MKNRYLPPELRMIQFTDIVTASGDDEEIVTGGNQPGEIKTG